MEHQKEKPFASAQGKQKLMRKNVVKMQGLGH